jgi:hypothetical protein
MDVITIAIALNFAKFPPGYIAGKHAMTSHKMRPSHPTLTDLHVQGTA